MKITDDFISRTYPSIYRYAYVLLKNKEQALDATQEAFYRLTVSTVDFDSDDKKKSWLLKVTSNICKSYWRSGWYKRIVPLGEKERDIILAENDPANAYYQKTQYEELEKSVFKLKPKYREVIQLYYYEELSTAQIAEVLERKESTIQTQLARARETLKTMIERKEERI